MKKLVSLFVALCMTLAMIPALAETAGLDAYLGVWYAVAATSEGQTMAFSDIGIELALELKDDGTAVQTTNAFGYEDSLTCAWKAEEGTVTVTINDMTLTASLQDDKLILADEESVTEFTRTKPESEAGEDGEDGEDGLKSMLGGLLSGETSEDGADLSSMLGGLLGSENGEGSLDLNSMLGGLLGSENGEGSLDLNSMLGGLLGGENGEGSLDLNSMLGGLLGSENGEGSLDLQSMLGGLLGGEDGEGSGLLSKLKGLFNGEDGEGSGLLSKLKGLLSGEDSDGNGLMAKLGSLFGGENGEGGSGLSSMLGGLLGGENSEDGTGLMSMLGGLLGGDASETKAAPAPAAENFIAADSAEQFFGTWTLSKATIQGYPISLEEVAAMLQTPLTFQVVLTGSSVTISFEENEHTEAIETVLTDGALVLTQNGETSTLKLTDAGELVMVSDVVNLYFTPVTEAAADAA